MLPPEVLAVILADPAAEGPRQVLADVLVENGDPRGEFIALDCLPDPTPRQRKRKGALLRHHHRAWLAGLEPLADTRLVRFDRGLLHTVGLLRGPVDGIRVEAEAALLREVAVRGGPRDPDLSAVLRRLPGLHTARGLRLAEWTASTGSLEELTVEGSGLAFLGTDGDVSRLRRLGLPIGTHPSFGRRVVGSLELERLDVGRGAVVDWLPVAPDVPELVVSGRHWRYRIGAGGREIEVEPIGSVAVSKRIEELATTVRTLPIGGLRWLWVRAGPRPGERALRGLRQAARGTPLRLPPTWTAGERSSSEDG